MTHPGPLLLEYVDGALDGDVRAEVEAHLRTCAACHEEVRLAAAGKRAANSLPAPTVPAGLSDAALAEAERIAAGAHPEVASIAAGARRRPNTQRSVGLVTAAAVVIAIALIAPNLGGSSGSVAEQAASAPAAGAGASSAASDASQRVLAADKDFTPQQLQDATTSAQQALRAEDAATTSAGSVGFAAADTAFGYFAGTPSTSTTVPEATGCLHRAFRSAEGKLVRVLVAKYNGRAAYFAIYVVAPGDGSSGELRIDVASVDGCQILAQSSAKL
jgi:Putative zinc-finger